MVAPLRLLGDRLLSALQTALPLDTYPQPLLLPASQAKFGDYQSNVCLSLAKQVGKAPRELAQEVVAHLNVEDLCQPVEIAGPGFLNFRLKPDFLARSLQAAIGSDRLGIPPAREPRRVVVDFSSPNIAKEMHVGHLRSTIIGDCIARILEFQGHDVLRLNHVGDWGTQFGMLIAYLDEVYPDALTTANALDLGDLVTFYKKAKQRFDSDPNFQQKARQQVVALQQGEEQSRRAWQLLCEQSRREFQKIYDLLDIELTERGESFYNPFLPAVIEDLAALGLVVEDQGAKVVFLEGFTNKEGQPQPLIIQKSDGGYNYATTDLAALRYRIDKDRADWIIYVTDVGQSTHFAQVFQVAQRAGWVPPHVTLTHVPFGLVLGEDGKRLKTRSGETIRLMDLLTEAIARSRADLEQRLASEGRRESPEFIDTVARAIGIGAVKYADLSQNRNSNYVFSYDKMLSLQGNTAPYLLYAYVRVQGLTRRGDIDWRTLSPDTPLFLEDETEQNLAKHLVQLEETLDLVSAELLPNRLCQYLFELSQLFNQFYDRCPILSATEPTKQSRLTLAYLTAQTLKLGLSLLGIRVLDRI
ncbi:MULTISPECIES: arginine--tRNA ligase [unclassified Thermosynechococcus]|uniref:arginine--tRNA ligase n=1 Tax=unclassified Thermosynechococcus TaxID=2622553 RepID=UPI00197FAEF1|nr:MULTISPECIES: arginine--tRNA ligase [unclassified Thermosynechococcus]QSF50189.1 arginine--tRNA ligase [Thermosynechococcus sp. TA-1]WNC23305.1 arginine--tRNA ligase [Thermosynechococcus sp. PP22]WNC33543.1 arginine--tRNA ligase [Thermosynechococcus sp. PKX95]WNC36065.1 arginine--tRNA ligase [Thermosynechococcus sp. PKX91]WNC38590.1 arginine--tRNA ligase [Thermosynechococcus sp. WL11]